LVAVGVIRVADRPADGATDGDLVSVQPPVICVAEALGGRGGQLACGRIALEVVRVARRAGLAAACRRGREGVGVAGDAVCVVAGDVGGEAAASDDVLDLLGAFARGVDAPAVPVGLGALDLAVVAYRRRVACCARVPGR
jgi:hypothetical protein